MQQLAHLRLPSIAVSAFFPPDPTEVRQSRAGVENIKQAKKNQLRGRGAHKKRDKSKFYDVNQLLLCSALLPPSPPQHVGAMRKMDMFVRRAGQVSGDSGPSSSAKRLGYQRFAVRSFRLLQRMR